MTEQENLGNKLIVCWSCDKSVTLRGILKADGFCPFCNCEIELDE